MSLVVAVEQKDTVKGIYDKVFQKLLRDIPEKDKKKVSELISGNALYFVDHNGAIEEVPFLFFIPHFLLLFLLFFSSLLTSLHQKTGYRRQRPY